MTIFYAIIIGLVQGITEFLPVSSSGHLMILRHVFHMPVHQNQYFDILLHIGVLIPVIILFFEDISGMLREFVGILLTLFANFLVFLRKKQGDHSIGYFKVVNSSYRKLVLMVLISSIPTGILGYVGSAMVEEAGNSLLLSGIFMIITGGILLLADQHPDGMLRVKNATYASSFVLGIAQGVASFPGLSRTGLTVSTGLLLGYNKKLAVKYSFIMWIPALMGTIFYELQHTQGASFGSENLPAYLIGALVTGIAGYFALKYILMIIQNKRYILFSIYCFCLGAFAVGYSLLR